MNGVQYQAGGAENIFIERRSVWRYISIMNGVQYRCAFVGGSGYADGIDRINEAPCALHFKAVKFDLARVLMRTIGRPSKGIEIGYAHGFDSGVMLDHVYDNRAKGRFLVGRLIDRVYLDAPGGAGIRNRGELLRKTIFTEAKNIAAGRPVAAKESLNRPLHPARDPHRTRQQ